MVQHTDLAKLFETLNLDDIGEKIASLGDRNISMLISSIMDKKNTYQITCTAGYSEAGNSTTDYRFNDGS